jgi:hypothetical protein
MPRHFSAVDLFSLPILFDGLTQLVFGFECFPHGGRVLLGNLPEFRKSVFNLLKHLNGSFRRSSTLQIVFTGYPLKTLFEFFRCVLVRGGVINGFRLGRRGLPAQTVDKPVDLKSVCNF